MVEVSVSQKAELNLAGAWEQAVAGVMGLCAAVLLNYFGGEATAYAHSHGWHLDQAYVAGFGFVSVTTGFLATFYATVQAVSDGFIGKIRKTKGRTLERFLALTKRAIIVGFAAALISMPMMVVVPFPTAPYALDTLLSSLWLGTMVGAISGFYQVASHFFGLLETRPSERISGG